MNARPQGPKFKASDSLLSGFKSATSADSSGSIRANSLADLS